MDKGEGSSPAVHERADIVFRDSRQQQDTIMNAEKRGPAADHDEVGLAILE